MTDRPLRRVVIVLAVYGVVAVVVVAFSVTVRRWLALPQMFESAVRWGVVLGIPVAAALAWKYPDLGHGDGPPEDSHRQ